MVHRINRMFLPLHRWAHRPDGQAYQDAFRDWMLARIWQRVQVNAHHTAIEIGCGNGFVSHQLARRFDRVVGFDINPSRIGKVEQDNVLLAAGDAACPPIADGAADLMVSVAVLEHLRDRVGVLRRWHRMLAPSGRMVHVVPTSAWKTLQWLGFVPDAIRKQVRGLTRSLAGQRKPKAAKYYQGMETNSPLRRKRRKWWQKLYPRIHGEYDSNWQEWIQWSHRSWTAQFQAAGFRVVDVIPLGLGSPYGLGISLKARYFTWLGVSSMAAFVLERQPT